MWRERRAFRKLAKQETKRIAPTVREAASSVKADAEAIQKELDALPGGTLRCPRCRSRMVLREGYGPFWGCIRYPFCHGTRNVVGGAGRG